MTERRFHVLPADVAPGRLVLRGAEAHHARRVLRLDVGARVTCFDGQGAAWVGTIARYGKDEAEVTPVEQLPGEPDAGPRITLAQAALKGDRMDWVVQKATELGARRIVPLRTDRVEPRAGDDKRAERWRRIALEAAKQCERNRLPEIAPGATLAAALASLEGAGIAFVERDGEPARPALAGFGASRSVTLFLGPEGGWTDAERASFEAADVARLSLGPRILRAETAAVVALAIVNYELG